MLPSFLSFVSFYEKYLRRCFSAAGLTRQIVDLHDDGQTTIAFWGPNNEDPIRSSNRPSLVLLHGFGPLALWQWRRQVQFFAPHFNLYVPDLIFFGGSTTKSAHRSETFQATSVGKLLETLGVKRYSVMGTSYGGFVAYEMARIWAERIEKVVIASSGVNMRRRDNVALMKRAGVDKVDDLMLPVTAKQLRTLMSLAVFKKVSDLLPNFFLNDFINKLYVENRKEKMELLKGLTLGGEDTSQLSPLPQEVLIIWGDHDQIFPVEMASELKEMLGAKAKLEVIENASHVPQIECPGKFNTIVNHFLCTSL